MHNYEYIGCFFDREELFRKIAHVRKNHLPNEKQAPHVTFAYAPEAVPEELFGQLISVTIIGYGNDGYNEGLLVTLSGYHPAINQMIAQIPVPHITLAVSNDGKAVNTRYIPFTPVEPIPITGQFGGFLNEDIEQE